MRVKRISASPIREYLSDDIKSIEEYKQLIEQKNNEEESEMVYSLAGKTMSKKVLREFLKTYLDMEGFPYSKIIQRQNISKLVGTLEFDRFIQGLMDNSIRFSHKLLTEQKWRGNQLDGLLLNFKLVDMMVNEAGYAETLSYVVNNNNLSYEAVISYIEKAERERPLYFRNEGSHRGGSQAYEKIGGALLNRYEVPKDYIMSRIDMFNYKTFHTSSCLNLEHFISKGFSFSELLQMAGGRFSNISMGLFVEWLKSENRIMEEIDVVRARVYLESIRTGVFDSGNYLVTLLVELHKDRNKALAIEEGFIKDLLRGVRLVPLVWSDAMLSIPKNLTSDIYESVNEVNFSSTIVIGKTKPSMTKVLHEIERRRTTRGHRDEELCILVSYETMKEWHQIDPKQFKEISKYVSLDSGNSRMFSSAGNVDEFISFMKEHFREELNYTTSNEWADLFRSGGIENITAFDMAIESLRRDRSKARGSMIPYPSNTRDIFANMYGPVKMEYILEFAEFINFTQDLRALDNGVESFFEKGEF